MPNADSIVLIDNLIRRIKDSSVYTELAENTKNNSAKSAYYRAAIMVVASITEGLVIYLIRKHTNSDNPVVSRFVEKRSVYSFANLNPSMKGVDITQEVQKPIKLHDRSCTIEVMNNYCLNEKLVTKKEFDRLEMLRKKRNSIHIQTLIDKDRGYTKAELKKAETVMSMLVGKIRTTKTAATLV